MTEHEAFHPLDPGRMGRPVPIPRGGRGVSYRTPENVRRIRVLRMEGFSNDEIAAALGIAPKTVHRALTIGVAKRYRTPDTKSPLCRAWR